MDSFLSLSGSPSVQGRKVYSLLRIQTTWEWYPGGMRMTREQDLERTIRALRETALGNCRKRIADAQRKKAEAGITMETREPESSTCYGVTMILKRRYNL